MTDHAEWLDVAILRIAAQEYEDSADSCRGTPGLEQFVEQRQTRAHQLRRIASRLSALESAAARQPQQATR